MDSSPNALSSPGTKVHYFGDYELMEEVGRGGMGVAYRARQVSLNRNEALKMILAGRLASEAEVKRFFHEARAAAKLQQPNIVTVHEVGLQDGQHYYSMDFIEGSDLEQLVREHPLPALLDLVVHREPVWPRALNPSVPRDPDTICLKCLQKDPARRYRSARDLSDELGRFSRVRRFWRVRQTWPRGPGAGAPGTGRSRPPLEQQPYSSWPGWSLAPGKRFVPEPKPPGAARSRQIAHFLQDMLKGVGPSVAQGRDTKMLREILDQTADRIGKELKGQPVAEAELRTTIGDVYLELGEYGKAEAMHREALKLAKGVYGQQHPEVATP